MAVNLGNYGKIGSYMEFSSKMLSNMNQYIKEDNFDRKRCNNIVPFLYDKDIVICPEPISFIQDITVESASEVRIQKLKNMISSFSHFKPQSPEKGEWFNCTVNGINLRLGNVDGDSGNQSPAVLGDDCVHGVVVGRTGSGKSVLINNIILNLITEYPPWELDLFLVDMKKVELSRYMSTSADGRYMTPHVVACGATSEVRYVVSMIQYIANCMQARQRLFAAVGVQKIQDFRKNFGVTLPRILLLVDEFQQMYLEASSGERRILEENITSITKLGRATGVHLLFASQEMAGALGSKELSNFKLRVALPCDESVSSSILGNSAAAKLDEKGITLVNTKGGSKEEDNITYKTPYIDVQETDDGAYSEFTQVLAHVYELNKNQGYKKTQKFYQEDVQTSMDKIKELRTHKEIKKQINTTVNDHISIVEAFILGTGTLYSPKKNDYESFFLEKGKKRNVGILCTQDKDIGNVLKTLVTNLKYSDQSYVHNIVYESEILRSIYSEMKDNLTRENVTAEEFGMEEFIREIDSWKYELLYRTDYSNASEILNKVFLGYLRRNKSAFLNILNNLNKKQSETTRREIKEYDEALVESLWNDILSQLDVSPEPKIFNQFFDCSNTLLNELKNKEKSGTKYLYLFGLIQLFMDCMDSTKKWGNDFLLNIQNSYIMKKKKPIIINWIIGTDNIDKSMAKTISRNMETCSIDGEFYVLAGSSPENMEDAFRCCNYMFLNSANESLYNKYKMSYTRRGIDNKTMDFKIINYNQERSYKQFKYESERYDVPRINFDDIEEV